MGSSFFSFQAGQRFGMRMSAQDHIEAQTRKEGKNKHHWSSSKFTAKLNCCDKKTQENWDIDDLFSNWWWIREKRRRTINNSSVVVSEGHGPWSKGHEWEQMTHLGLTLSTDSNAINFHQNQHLRINSGANSLTPTVMHFSKMWATVIIVVIRIVDRAMTVSVVSQKPGLAFLRI